jgi:phosphonate transport system substrate-binding protein
MFARFAFCVAIALLWVGPVNAKTPEVLNIGLISTESAQNLSKQWDPLLADMEKALGCKVKAFFAPDYAGIIQAMRFDKIEVAWLGNKSAMEAVDRAGGEVFAQMVDKEGLPGYWSLLIVQRDSPLKTLDDLLKAPGQHTFGNGDPNSTSGFLVPAYYVFAMHNISPLKHFKRVVNASHEVNALAGANKQVDVATNNTENIGVPGTPYEKSGRLWKTYPEKAAQIRAIWQSPLIASDPMVYRANLDPEVKARIKTFFLDYGRKGPNVEQELKILAGISAGLAPFKASTNDQLIPIRQMSLYQEKLKIQSDQRMDQAEKDKRVRSIDDQLAQLNDRLKAVKSN